MKPFDGYAAATEIMKQIDATLWGIQVTPENSQELLKFVEVVVAFCVQKKELIKWQQGGNESQTQVQGNQGGAVC